MESKMVWLGLFIGSAVGSYLPMLWGAGLFSLSSVIFSGLGGIAGIYIFYKISRY